MKILSCAMVDEKYFSTYGISNAISKDIWPLCEPNIETATLRCVTRSSYKSGLSTTAMYRSKEMHPKN